MLKNKIKKIVIIIGVVIVILLAAFIIWKQRFAADVSIDSVQLKMYVHDSASPKVIPTEPLDGLGGIEGVDVVVSQRLYGQNNGRTVVGKTDAKGFIKLDLPDPSYNFITISKTSYSTLMGTATYLSTTKNPSLISGFIGMTLGEGITKVHFMGIAEGQNLITFPGIAKDTDPASILKYWNYTMAEGKTQTLIPQTGLIDIPADGSWVTWTAVKPFNLQPDRGYWLKSQKNVFLSYPLDISAKQTSTLYLDKLIKAIRPLPLTFDQSIDYQQLQFESSGITKNYTDAVSAGWINKHLSTYDPTTKKYLTYNPVPQGKSPLLHPGIAYFIYTTKESISLVVPSPTKETLAILIYGKITDNAGNPMTNMQVNIGNSMAVSNADGTYRISTLKPGSYLAQFNDSSGAVFVPKVPIESIFVDGSQKYDFQLIPR